ncbi:hypothetical protein Emag_006431 [Eimeria magna]
MEERSFGAPVGAPKQDLEAAREIAAAAAQGNILAAAAAAQFFSPEDAASLKAAALLAPWNRGRRGGPRASDPLAAFFEGPPPQHSGGKHRHERAFGRESKHSRRRSSKHGNHRRLSLSSESVAESQWGPPEGATSGAPVEAPSVRKGRRRHSTGKQRQSSHPASRKTSKETAPSRDCSSCEEMRARRHSNHAYRKQQLQQQQQQQQHQQQQCAGLYAGRGKKKEKKRKDSMQILTRLIECRRLETQIEGDLHQLAMLDSLLLQREATDAASVSVVGQQGAPLHRDLLSRYLVPHKQTAFFKKPTPSEQSDKQAQASKGAPSKPSLGAPAALKGAPLASGTRAPPAPAKGPFPAAVAVPPASGVAAPTGGTAAPKKINNEPSVKENPKASKAFPKAAVKGGPLKVPLPQTPSKGLPGHKGAPPPAAPAAPVSKPKAKTANV